MPRLRFVALFPVLLLIGEGTGWAGDIPKIVKEVAIKSFWSGLGNSQKTELLIHKEKNNYYVGKKSVPTDLVEALLSALEEPAIPQPQLANLGITPQWLKENAVSAALKNAPNFADAAQNQKELFITSYNNLDLLNKIVPSMFLFTRFDDYPSVEVVVTFEDGSSVEANSHLWYEFMLPWKLSRNHETSYNADISRALAALMPKKATNRERLAGQGFDAALAKTVMSYIDADWKLLDAGKRAETALTEIRRKYSIERAEINPYHHPEYGTATYKGEPEEMNLHATVRKPTFPPNVTDALVLRYVKGEVEGIPEFLKKAQKYEDLTLSVPWLSQFILEHPSVEVRISYVHDLSFGDKAMQVFRNDMHAIRKDFLIKDAEAEKSELVLLIVGTEYAETYWLVFPDKRVILWRYGGPSGLLKWKDTDFSTKRCSEYQGVFGGCVGAVVSTGGELAQSKKAMPD